MKKNEALNDESVIALNENEKREEGDVLSESDSTQESDPVFQNLHTPNNKSNRVCKINILCTHVTHNDTNQTGVRFPFIQYLLEKKRFNYNQLELPSIVVDRHAELKDEGEYESMVVAYISALYRSVFPNANELSVDNCYVGSCHLGENNDIYALVDVSDVWSDIHYAGMSSSNRAWFALSSEIINTRNVCGLAVNEKTSRFFTEYPELSKLNSVPGDQVFPIPDVGYTIFSDILSARVACMFGPPITNIGVKKGFCFNSLLSDVTKINPKGNGSLTRYAVFYPEEDEDDNGDDENNTQHMVHDYDMFLPMTFHILTKTNQGIL